MSSSEAINNVDLSGYDPTQRAMMERALEAIQVLDRDEVERLTQRTWGTITRFFQGKPQGDVAGVLADLERLADRAAGELVRTPIVEDYWRVLDSIRRGGGMGAIVARTGRGKTLTLTTYWRQAGATCVLAQVPSGCTPAELARVILDAMGIDTDGIRQPERKRKLFASLTARHTLLIDEAGYLVQDRRQTSGLRLLQDLHDDCGCGIVLAMRPTQWSQFVSGRTANDDEQLLGRISERAILAASGREGESAGYKMAEVEAIMLPFCGTMDKRTRTVARDLLRRDVGGLRALVHVARTAAQFAAAFGKPFAEAFEKEATLRDRSAHVLTLADF